MNFNESPQEITTALSITPSEVKIKGEKFPRGSVLGNNVWLLSSETESLILEEHMWSILNKLDLNKLSGLRKKLSHWESSFNCSIEISNTPPSLYLSSNVLKILGDYNINLDIDIL